MCFNSAKASTTQSTSQTDKRIGVAGDGIVATEGSSISLIDGGTVDLAKELGLSALSSGEEIALAAIANAQILGTGALSSIATNADKAFEFVDKQRQDSDARVVTSIIPWLVGGASIVAIAVYMKGAK